MQQGCNILLIFVEMPISFSIDFLFCHCYTPLCIKREEQTDAQENSIDCHERRC